MDEQLVLKCNNCGKIGKNAFPHPFNYAECISQFHSPRYENEYYWKCPFCGNVIIYPSIQKTDDGL